MFERQKNALAVALLAAACVVPGVVQAQGRALPRWTEEWAARGLTSSVSASGLWIGDVAGGLKQGGVYNTLGTATFEADLEKLTGGWHGASAGVDLYWIRGKSASWYFVGDALTVSNLDGFDSIRLYQVWLQQEWAEGRVSLRAGSLAADEEFAGTESGGMFSNGAFGWIAGIGANIVNGGPIYYAPAPGARLAVKPAESWTVQAAIYDGDSFDSPGGDPEVNSHGLHFAMNSAQGSFAIAELSHDWQADPNAPLPGSARFGLWRHSADFEDQWADANGASFALSGEAPAVHRGNRGWYGALEQRVWTERGSESQGLTGWLRVAGAPAERSAVEWSTDAGVRWAGLIPGRDDDAFGVGVATAYVSRAAQRSQLDAWSRDGESGVLPDFERVVEATYQWQLGERWIVAPGVQWVQHPGLSAETPNAWVPSLRVSFE
ncbi:MAG: carbohydrate porin [Burkholderiaceae bacterium]